MTAELINQVLTKFDPEPDGLLREICKHIDDEMLEQIALADYGEDSEKHLAALREIRDTGRPPVKMEWCPTEVLELIRWSEPDEPYWKPGATGQFGHWMRAFCTATLLRGLREPTNYDTGGNESTLINFILSLRVLPIDLNQQARSFLSWLLLHTDLEGNDEAICAYGAGLLWFAVLDSAPARDEALEALVDWILQRSKELYPKLVLEPGGLPIRLGFANPPPSAWRSLGEAMLELDLRTRSPKLRLQVRLVGTQLAL